MRTLFATLLLLAACARAEVEVTASWVGVDGDGYRTPYLAFHEGKELVLYCPPTGWKASPAAPGISLTAPVGTRASAHIFWEMRDDTTTFDPAGIAKLAGTFKSRASSEATNATVTSQTKIDRWLSGKSICEFVGNYTVAGEEFGFAWIVSNLEQGRLNFEFRSPISSFKQLYGGFKESLVRLTWCPPSENIKPIPEPSRYSPFPIPQKVSPASQTEPVH